MGMSVNLGGTIVEPFVWERHNTVVVDIIGPHIVSHNSILLVFTSSSQP